MDNFHPNFNILKFAGSPLGFRHSAKSKLNMALNHPHRIPVTVTDVFSGKSEDYLSLCALAKARKWNK